MTETGRSARGLQAELGLRSHNTIYRYLRAESGKAGGQVPQTKVMRKLIKLSGGVVTPNDFHGINGSGTTAAAAGGGAPGAEPLLAQVRNGASASSFRARGRQPMRPEAGSIRPIAVRKKRKPSSLASRRLAGKKAAATRARQKRSRA